MSGIFDYFKLYEFINALRKICKLLGKMKFWAYHEFCAYSKDFGLRQSPEWKYWLLNVLPNQAICQIENTSTASLHSKQWFHEKEEAKFM